MTDFITTDTRVHNQSHILSMQGALVTQIFMQNGNTVVLIIVHFSTINNFTLFSGVTSNWCISQILP